MKIVCIKDKYVDEIYMLRVFKNIQTCMRLHGIYFAVMHINIYAKDIYIYKHMYTHIYIYMDIYRENTE